MTNRSVIFELSYSAYNIDACNRYVYNVITKLVSRLDYYNDSPDKLHTGKLDSEYIKWLTKQENNSYSLKYSYDKTPLDLVHRKLFTRYCNDYTNKTIVQLSDILSRIDYEGDANLFAEKFSLVYDIIIRYGQYNSVYCVLLLKHDFSLKEILKFDKLPTFLDTRSLFDSPYEYAKYTQERRKRR
jgi:hypothetical protein